MMNLRLHYLFQKYINRNCTAQEYDELMVLISDQSNERQLEQMIVDAENNLPDEKLGRKQAERIYQTIINKEESKVIAKSNIKNWGFYGVAASVILLLVWGVFLKKHPIQPLNNVRLMSIKTISDHRLIKLSDGSTVVLNKNSHIDYPAVFMGTKREVTLTGEGYFDIKHNARQPFLVHVGKLTVTVLGTAFNIKSNASGKNVAVTVTRGKVSVSKNRQLIGMLVPNHQIVVNEADAKPQLRTINAAKTVKWQAGDFYFNDVTMDSAITMLSDHFNARIRFDNERVKHCTLTGTFTHNESLQQILKVLCSFNNAKYELKPGSEILISGPGCN
jgi:transmembrane sensor